MIVTKHRCAASIVVLTALLASPCVAETQLFERENIAAWADIRGVISSGERGWLDKGFGKTRYGGEDSGVHLAQAALVWTPRLTDTLKGYANLQYVPDAESAINVSEAYLVWKPVPTSPLRYTMRAGLMFPPVSQEHDGPGWTTTRTLTPSAINAWIGEEVLVTGLEASVRNRFGDHDLGLTAGLFGGNDTSGTVLTWRGWALHDMSSGHNSVLPLPAGGNGGYTTIFKAQAPLSDPVVDVDGRAGGYLRLDWRPPAAWAVNLTYYDNRGNPEWVDKGQYGWDTQFGNLGFRWQPSPTTEVLSQYMWGATKMGHLNSAGRRGADISFDSAYLLVTRRLGTKDRATARLDYFAANDHSMPERDNNNELGYAATVAWSHPVDDHLEIVTEALHVTSSRPARATQFAASRQTQTQIQVALRLRL